MDVLIVLVSLFCLGILVWASDYVARQFRLPVIIIALVFGLLFGAVADYFGIFRLQLDYFSTLGLLAFVILVFDGFVRLKLKSLDTVAMNSFAFVALFAGLIFVGFAFVLYLLLGWSPLSSVVFASSILGVSAVIVFLPRVLGHISAIIQLESYWTSPLALLLPLIFVIFAPPLPLIFVSDLANFVFFVGIKIIASVSAGVFVGILLLKILHLVKKEFVLPVVFAAVFIAFGLAYFLGGYGVIAVATLGFFFANVFVSFNSHFGDFDALFAKYAGILCVVLLGFVSRMSFSPKFFVVSILLFLFYLIIRYAAVFISYKKHSFSAKELGFLVLYAPNGFSTAAILLFLGLFPPMSVSLAELFRIVDLGIMFIIYSNITAFAISRWRK